MVSPESDLFATRPQMDFARPFFDKRKSGWPDGEG
jgi:hypothetical protein